jgi:hypothetical protein
MRAIVAFVLIAAATMGTACGGARNLEQELRGFVDATQESVIEYLYAETTDDDRNTEVRARIEDSIRHSETLSIGGVLVMERIVHDDALAVHVLAPDQVPQIASPDPADLAVAEALRAGQWIVDPAGAPPEGATDTEKENLGADPFKDATSVFQYARQAIDQAIGVFEFNPESLDYLAEQDPFPRPKERAGEKRFDLIPPPLPRREQEKLPGPAPFRKMAFYVMKNRVIRILEEIDIESQPDVKRAHETGRNPFFLRLAREVKLGKSSQPVRERTMSVEIISMGRARPLDVPQQGSIGNLRVLFGEKKQTVPTTPGQTPPGLPVPAPGGSAASPPPAG